MKKMIFLFAIIAISLGNVKSQTLINGSYFGANLPTYLWDMGGSPYHITEDIKIPDGSDLIIEPGVEILFQGHYKMDVKGSINAIGNYDERIVFTSDAENPWNGIRFNFSDNPNPSPSKLHFCDISNAGKTGTICTSPDPESSGGAIYVQSFSDLEIYECHIFKNSVLGQGGAIGLFENSSPTVSKCWIHSNLADKRGGGICMMIYCDPEIVGNTIENNSSVSRGGGGIAIGDLGTGYSSNPTIVGNDIFDNSASSSGGGMFICNSDVVIFSENTFIGNTAQLKGGGVSIQKNSTVEMDNNTFINNISSVNGGGVHISNLSPNVTMDYCHFSGNSAVDGGGIYVGQSETDVANCTFTTNTASNSGGGIYVLESISTIEKCTFEENTAIANGGGIFMDKPTINSIRLNKFKSNTASQGSALYYFRIYNITDTYVLNNLFVENHATDMGVVYMQGDNSNTIFNHNTVSNNTSTTWISGVCVSTDNDFPNVVSAKNFYNNIIYEPLSVVDILIISTYQHPSIYSTLITKNCLQSNPNFVSSTDYHLSSSSICIDAGNNLATMTGADLDGNQRTYNGTTDYGCYEYISAPPPIQPIQPFQSDLNDNSDNNIDIKTYPNPASDVLNISNDGGSIVNVSIFDLNGRKVYDTGTISINNTLEIPVNSLLPGSYFLCVQLENEIVNRKILIQ